MREGLIAYALTCGGDDAELHEKSVFFSLAMITASETGIFEYDPQDEPPSGRPPGPWDGYSLFTIDLSAVKDDIEDLQQQLSDLEDCRDAVIQKIQEYFPSFDPQTCQDLVDKIEADEDDFEEKEELCEKVQQAIEEETGESVDPEDIPDKVHELPGYTFPKKPDGTDPTIDEILTLVATDPITSNDKAVSFYYKVYVSGSDVPEHRNIYKAEGGDAWDGQATSGSCCYTVDGVEYAFTGGGYINGATGFHIISISPLSGGGGFTYESETWVYTGGTPDGYWRANSTTTVSSAPLQGWGAPPYKVKNS